MIVKATMGATDTDFSFRNFPHRTHTKCLCQIMVEDAAGLDYIKDKVAKRTVEIIFHAECGKIVQICVKSHELLVQQELKVWTFTCTVNKSFSL